MLAPLLYVLCLDIVSAQHFFGPPAIGFGAGLISIRRSLPLATSIGGSIFSKKIPRKIPSHNAIPLKIEDTSKF